MEKNLKKRYALWFYKQLREGLDRTKRKETQLDIDRLYMKSLERIPLEDHDPETAQKIQKYMDDFYQYIQKKETQFKNERTAEFALSGLKLLALEEAITKDLGKETLDEIRSLYEREMRERILKEKTVPGTHQNI